LRNGEVITEYHVLIAEVLTIISCILEDLDVRSVNGIIIHFSAHY